jgi:hypothetical protein
VRLDPEIRHNLKALLIQIVTSLDGKFFLASAKMVCTLRETISSLISSVREKKKEYNY